MMDDPFSNHYLLLWFANNDDLIHAYYDNLNDAEARFDVWVRESKDNGEEHSIILMINLYQSIKDQTMRTVRVWETQYE